jgi:hypothetical protein
MGDEPRSGEPTPGHRLFARYAHGPNALGYCGPQATADLRALATGGQPATDIYSIARQFSGAWPYQKVMAELAGYDDPLDKEVVRAYWTGNSLTQGIEREQFFGIVLDQIKPQAGHYWAHLTDELAVEAAPTHAFHVFSVYPWSRLLSSGRPEPLDVIESCRIGWGRIEAVHETTVTVSTRKLAYADGHLFLADEILHEVSFRDDQGPLISAPARGEVVAIHWGQVCDRLSPYQAMALAHWTEWQLDAIAPRLAADHAATLGAPSDSSPELGRA